MTNPLRIGLIGCGNISTAYLARAKNFGAVSFRAVADINPATAQARGEEFGVEAMSVDALLAHPEDALRACGLSRAKAARNTAYDANPNWASISSRQITSSSSTISWLSS